MIYQIKSPYFTAGITFVNDKADKAAPIIKYMIGWTLDAVKSYCFIKRWDIAEIKERVK